MSPKKRPRERPPRKKPPAGDPSDPRGWESRIAAYLAWLETHNYSPQTVGSRDRHLFRFADWCVERGIGRPQDVTLPILERYQRRLYRHRKKDGQPLSFRFQRTRLSILKGFFSWLTKHRLLLSNPASELELPRIEKRLPKHVLSRSEVERVLAVPDLDSPFGLRDRAMLEVFYSTGMRRMELANLRLYDLDVERGTVQVRQGKGKVDRMVPIGERALAWVDRYLTEARPLLVTEPDEGIVFLTQFGDPFRLNALSQVIGRIVDRAELGKRGSCHLFRHSMATMMLEGGADVRFIQAMLGHAQLTSTQVYTHVAIRKLKEIHTATHPGARLQRSASGPEGLEDAGDIDGLAEDLEAAIDGERTDDADDLEELLGDLDDEEDEP